MPAPRKYDEETIRRAVQMYRDRLAEGEISQLAARNEVGELLGINPATLRNWIRREDGTRGSTSGSSPSTGESVEAENARRGCQDFCVSDRLGLISVGLTG